MIGISLLTLVPGEVGGSETYVRALTARLAARGALDAVALVPPIAADAGEGLPSVVVDEYGHARTAPERARAMLAAAARPGPVRRRYGGLDAVHYPLTIALPPVRVPSAVTLHDLLHLDHPELFSRGLALVRKVTYDRSARRADLVVVPSAYVRDRAIERLGLPAERLRVVHHGIDHARFRPGEPREREPLLVYPARPWPHKNHARLFEAFALLRRERPELELVLTGGGHEGRPVPAGVRVAGLVPADELVSLYRRAAALVFPSLSEGFGAPPLEAMACGCPAAVARAGSLPEVVGDAAATFDPRAPEEMAEAVGRLLDDPAPWVERGLARAAQFDWDASARAHESVYRELEP